MVCSGGLVVLAAGPGRAALRRAAGRRAREARGETTPIDAKSDRGRNSYPSVSFYLEGRGAIGGRPPALAAPRRRGSVAHHRHGGGRRGSGFGPEPDGSKRRTARHRRRSAAAAGTHDGDAGRWHGDAGWTRLPRRASRDTSARRGPNPTQGRPEVGARAPAASPRRARPWRPAAVVAVRGVPIAAGRAAPRRHPRSRCRREGSGRGHPRRGAARRARRHAGRERDQPRRLSHPSARAAGEDERLRARDDARPDQRPTPRLEGAAYRGARCRARSAPRERCRRSRGRTRRSWCCGARGRSGAAPPAASRPRG